MSVYLTATLTIEEKVRENDKDQTKGEVDAFKGFCEAIQAVVGATPYECRLHIEEVRE